MASPIDTLAATVGSAFANIFHAATLRRHVAGTIVDPADPPAPTIVDYACRALVSEFSKYLIAQGYAAADQRNVLILATSLAVEPIVDDIVIMNAGPFSGQSFALMNPILIDPAKALWDCAGRP
jgi:hypothetical protein